MLNSVEWGEYKIGDLFTKKTIKGVPKSCENLTHNEYGYYMFGQNIKYQYQHKIKLDDKYLQIVASKHPILAYTSSVGEIGIIKESFYRSGDNGAFQGLFPKNHKFKLKEIQFILSIIKKQFDFFGYATGMSDIINLKILLPTKNSKIDFDFMESFIAQLEAERIAQLEAYLVATGLKDYVLTDEEERALGEFESLKFKEFTYKSIFNKIVQGRRLKKDDQISGNIPFVMAGTTNTGVVNYISNPVASFPQNSITVDIFGNTFYRNYDFGAGDDTGVYWSDEKNYSKETMLFFVTSMEKSVFGKFSFGDKLRSSQSLNFKMQLPTQNNQPDYAQMETFISAIQKLVIKEVVLYADKKIATTKSVVTQ
jgi:hypothetical protein